MNRSCGLRSARSSSGAARPSLANRLSIVGRLTPRLPSCYSCRSKYMRLLIPFSFGFVGDHDCDVKTLPSADTE